MAEEFEGDLAGAVFWGADLTGARFRDVNLTGVHISHAWLVDVDIDALVERVVINGVDVTAFVNERDPWYPLRSMLRPTTPVGLRSAWTALREEWAATLAQAGSLSEEQVNESVGGEFSFVQTLRHLLFAMDKWFTAPVAGGAFHPLGLPNTGSLDFAWPVEVEADATPSYADVLALREERGDRFGDYLASIDDSVDLTQPVEVLENGTVPLQECLFTVFEEEFWHLRYARRDLLVVCGDAERSGG